MEEGKLEWDRGRDGSCFPLEKGKRFCKGVGGTPALTGLRSLIFKFGWFFLSSGPGEDTTPSLWLQQWEKVFFLDWKVPGKRVAV